MDWGRRGPSRAVAVGGAGHVLEPLANPRSEPGYDLNHKGMDRPSVNTWLVKGHRLKRGRGGGLGGRGGEPETTNVMFNSVKYAMYINHQPITPYWPQESSRC